MAALPLLLVNLLLLSMDAALRRGDLPLFPPSGFSIHHELFPVPSFWTRIKRLCSDRLCLMEFCRRERNKLGEEQQTNREICLPFSPKHLRSALACKCKSICAGGSLLKTPLPWQLTYRGERGDFKVTQQLNVTCTNTQKMSIRLPCEQYILSRKNCTHAYLETYCTCGPLFPSQKQRGPL